jgi:hypothetical protein
MMANPPARETANSNRTAREAFLQMLLGTTMFRIDLRGKK